jgi:predicted transposase/invertase (TIGR01784 family)
VSHPKQLHDALFKATFSDPARAGSELRAVLPPELVALIDFSTLILAPGSFVDHKLRGTQSDLLFHCRVRGKPALLYVLFEHQSSSDELMAFRMLRYVVRILERYIDEAAGSPLPLPVVIPVVLHHSATGWTAARSTLDLFDLELVEVADLASYVPRLNFLLDDLSKVTDTQLAERNLGDFVSLVLWSLRDSRSPGRLLLSLDFWADAMQRLALANPAALEQIFRYLLGVIPDVEFKLFRSHLPEQAPAAEQVIMTMAEQLEAKGRAEGEARGRAEGEARGRAEGLRRMLMHLLSLKFGPPPGDTRARIDTAGEDELLLWSERVLTAESLVDVFAS